jgi:nucleoside-diphosphate-sugar epimerase
MNVRMSRQRILVSGGSGFLGSHLCERLLKDGHEVVCLDNFFTGARANIEHLLDDHRFELVRHDVTEPITMEVDQVYHLACPASPIHYQRNPVRTIRTAVEGTLNMLDLAREVRARILIASTSEVYGDPIEHPQQETYWGNVNPIGPRSVYDESKRYSEALVMAYHRYRGVNTHLARIFNTYGPRLDPADGRVISNFLMQGLRGEPLTVYGDGQQTRSFCYVSDLIEAIVRLSRTDEHLPVNIGNPSEFTVLECAKEVIEVTGCVSGIRHESAVEDDPTRRRPDITKARELLGWEPTITLREGLEKSLPYFRSKI